MKIYGASTASHRQNYTSLYSFDCEFRRCRNSLLFNTSGIRAAAEKSSTYQRYASALFSANSLYLHCLFLKALEIWRIYCVALAKEYILVRFCPRVSAVPKHRYCLIRAASVPLLKIFNTSERTGMSVVLRSIEFAMRTRSQRLYKEVQSLACLRLICARASYLHRLFSKALEILNGIYFSPEPSRRIRTDKDVRGSKQYRVRIANSQTTTVQGGIVVVVPAGVFCALLASASPISKRLTETLFLKALDILNGIYFSPEPSQRSRTDRDVRGFVRSEFVASKLVVGQHTGRYAVQQAISKSVYSLWLHYCLCFKFFLCVFYTFFITFLLSLTYTYMNHIPINNPGAACKHKLAARLKGVTL